MKCKTIANLSGPAISQTLSGLGTYCRQNIFLETVRSGGLLKKCIGFV